MMNMFETDLDSNVLSEKYFVVESLLRVRDSKRDRRKRESFSRMDQHCTIEWMNRIFDGNYLLFEKERNEKKQDKKLAIRLVELNCVWKK